MSCAVWIAPFLHPEKAPVDTFGRSAHWWMPRWSIESLGTSSSASAFDDAPRARTSPDAHVIVASGMGAHAYWVLGEPTSDLARVEAINRGVRAKLAGDNAIDAARILRLAGTYNYKHGQRLPVRLVE